MKLNLQLLHFKTQVAISTPLPVCGWRPTLSPLRESLSEAVFVRFAGLCALESLRFNGLSRGELPVHVRFRAQRT